MSVLQAISREFFSLRGAVRTALPGVRYIIGSAFSHAADCAYVHAECFYAKKSFWNTAIRMPDTSLSPATRKRNANQHSKGKRDAIRLNHLIARQGGLPGNNH